jgi:hypothetical protein
VTAATVAVMRALVLGVPAMKTPAMRALAWEEKSRREGVSKEEVQEEGVPCGAVLVSAALLVAPLAMSPVATKAVEAMKAMAVVKRVISLAVYVQGGDDGEMGRDRSVSSYISLRSSSSQRRFRVFFAGGGNDGDEVWLALGGDVGRGKKVT